MARDDGFAIADVSTRYYSDPKIVQVARRLQDPVRTHHALGLHQALVLASWAEGVRLTLEDARPAWDLEDHPELEAALRDVGLIDDENRIPIHAWESWHQPAALRREKRRDDGIVFGLMGHGMTREQAEAEAARRKAALTGGSPGQGEPGDTSGIPRADLDPGTPRPVPSVPSVPSAPSDLLPPNPPPSGGQEPRRNGRRADGTSPRQLAALEAAQRAEAEKAQRFVRGTPECGCASIIVAGGVETHHRTGCRLDTVQVDVEASPPWLRDSDPLVPR